MPSIPTYVNEAIEELRHVRWPTRQQAIRLSVIVIAFTLICAAFFGLVDYALTKLLSFALTNAQ